MLQAAFDAMTDKKDVCTINNSGCDSNDHSFDQGLVLQILSLIVCINPQSIEGDFRWIKYMKRRFGMETGLINMET